MPSARSPPLSPRIGARRPRMRRNKASAARSPGTGRVSDTMAHVHETRILYGLSRFPSSHRRSVLSPGLGQQRGRDKRVDLQRSPGVSRCPPVPVGGGSPGNTKVPLPQRTDRSPGREQRHRTCPRERGQERKRDTDCGVSDEADLDRDTLVSTELEADLPEQS